MVENVFLPDNAFLNGANRMFPRKKGKFLVNKGK